MFNKLKDSKRFKLKVGVFLVLFQDNEVLLLRRFNTGIADGRYVLPMGGLEEGETVRDAVIREAKEEINLTISPIGLRIVHMMHRLHHLQNGDSFPQIDIFFLPHSYEGAIENREPHKCDEVQFYSLDALPIETEKFIVQALQCIQNGELYSEIGWEETAECKEKTQKEPLSSTIYETTAKTYFFTEHTTDLFSYACKYRPHLFLDPKIRAGMTLLQLPEYAEDVRVGCLRLQEDITSGAIHRVISEHESDLGEGIIFSGRKQSC